MYGNNINQYGKRRMNEPHKFVLNFPQRLDLRSSNKNVVLQSLSIYWTWKNIRKQYKNNRLKIIVPTWNDEFELSDDSYSVSNNQDYTMKNMIIGYKIISWNIKNNYSY